MGTGSSGKAYAGDIWEELARGTDLPSPPGIAANLLRLAQSPQTTYEEVESIVRLDPAIAAKLLRMANSSLFPRTRKIDNLKLAISQFGLNGTVTIALSFSLIKAPRYSSGTLDLNRFWLRSLASAVICKKLSDFCCPGNRETFYLAGLVQDIGILALSRIRPELYHSYEDQQACHHAQIALEQALLGVDHSAVGAWLLEQWYFPQQYIEATRTSHQLERADIESQSPRLGLCVAVASYLADLWSLPDIVIPQQLGKLVIDELHLDDEDLRTLLFEAHVEIGEVAQLFDIREIDDKAIDYILSQARESLTIRSLLIEKTLNEANDRVSRLEHKTVQLAEKLDYDELTGVHTRSYAYRFLESLFEPEARSGLPVSVLYIDLDDFKQINDRYGHSAGDTLLSYAAKILQQLSAEKDVVARIGGEEFLIIMSGADYQRASTLCRNLVSTLAESSISVSDGVTLQVTASIGLSIHGEQRYFASAGELLDSADMGCYQAKNSGKNRWVYAAG